MLGDFKAQLEFRTDRVSAHRGAGLHREVAELGIDPVASANFKFDPIGRVSSQRQRLAINVLKQTVSCGLERNRSGCFRFFVLRLFACFGIRLSIWRATLSSSKIG
jgi:hypothetical protein